MLFLGVALCVPRPASTTEGAPVLASTDAPRQRLSFARLHNRLELPNLIDIQRRSFDWLVDVEDECLSKTIIDGSPSECYTG